jgi:hypothetical protein
VFDELNTYTSTFTHQFCRPPISSLFHAENGGGDFMKTTRYRKTPLDLARTEEMRQFLIQQRDNIHNPLAKITEGSEEDEEEEVPENYDF